LINLQNLKFFLFITFSSDEKAFDNVNENPLLEYLMSDQLFDALIPLLNIHQQRHQNGYKIILLLTILLNYRKYEVNSYLIINSIHIILI